MKPLNIVLAEAGLELVPKEIENHPVVVKNAQKRRKKPSETLLDISLHYSAMKKLSKWYKRGRPDIVHISLMNALSSPLNIAGLLRVYVHTINDKIIHIDPTTRLPRNYNRFIGLFEQLLVAGLIPPGSEKPLLWVEEKNLREFVNMMNFDKVVLMEEHGVRKTIRVIGEELAKLMNEGKNICIIIGAFQHGDFEETTRSLAHEQVSIFHKSLDSWIVVSRVIEGVENALGLC
ncbi:MAG: 16S rRNA methyltransferase [Ignisphaera sp.]